MGILLLFSLSPVSKILLLLKQSSVAFDLHVSVECKTVKLPLFAGIAGEKISIIKYICTERN